MKQLKFVLQINNISLEYTLVRWVYITRIFSIPSWNLKKEKEKKKVVGALVTLFIFTPCSLKFCEVPYISYVPVLFLCQNFMTPSMIDPKVQQQVMMKPSPSIAEFDYGSTAKVRNQSTYVSIYYYWFGLPLMKYLMQIE